jgi:hypothetical protein
LLTRSSPLRSATVHHLTKVRIDSSLITFTTLLEPRQNVSIKPGSAISFFDSGVLPVFRMICSAACRHRIAHPTFKHRAACKAS